MGLMRVAQPAVAYEDGTCLAVKITLVHGDIMRIIGNSGRTMDDIFVLWAMHLHAKHDWCKAGKEKSLATIFEGPDPIDDASVGDLFGFLSFANFDAQSCYE